MAKTKSANRKKQPELPHVVGTGVSPVVIEELEALAEAYVKERDKRLKMTPKEVAAKTALNEGMRRHEDKLRQPDGTLVYRYDESEIIVEPGPDKVKVRAFKIDEPEEE